MAEAGDKEREHKDVDMDMEKVQEVLKKVSLEGNKGMVEGEQEEMGIDGKDPEGEARSEGTDEADRKQEQEMGEEEGRDREEIGIAPGSLEDYGMGEDGKGVNRTSTRRGKGKGSGSCSNCPFRSTRKNALIECSKCEKWVCAVCADIGSEKEIEQVGKVTNKNKGVIFLCKGCIGAWEDKGRTVKGKEGQAQKKESASLKEDKARLEGLLEGKDKEIVSLREEKKKLLGLFEKESGVGLVLKQEKVRMQKQIEEDGEMVTMLSGRVGELEVTIEKGIRDRKELENLIEGSRVERNSSLEKEREARQTLQQERDIGRQGRSKMEELEREIVRVKEDKEKVERELDT